MSPRKLGHIFVALLMFCRYSICFEARIEEDYVHALNSKTFTNTNRTVSFLSFGTLEKKQSRGTSMRLCFRLTDELPRIHQKLGYEDEIESWTWN